MCKMYSDQWGEIDSSRKIERKVYLDSVNIPGVRSVICWGKLNRCVKSKNDGDKELFNERSEVVKYTKGL